MDLKCMMGLHQWNGCKCAICKKIRKQQHTWNDTGCLCTTCGQENHDWEDISPESNRCVLNGGEQCTECYNAPIKNCSKLPHRIYVRSFRCKKCGAEKAEETT